MRTPSRHALSTKALVTVHNTTFKALIDTGASMSLINEHFASELNVKMSEGKIPIITNKSLINAATNKTHTPRQE